MIQQPRIHTSIVNQGHTLHYCQFSGVSVFHEFVDRQIPRLSTPNRSVFKAFNRWVGTQIAASTTVFGEEVPDSVASLNTYSVFGKMHLLAQIRSKLQSKLHAFLYKTENHTVSTSQLEWNDKGVGSFSFAMASMGLFKSIPMATKDEEGLEAQVEKLKIALELTGIGSSVRKSYVHFGQHKGSRPALELYVTAGGNANIEGEALHYVGIACAELTTYMESKGIPIAIYVVLATFWNHQSIAGIICLKRFEASLDINQLLLLSSDPKYFRYRGCKALIALGDYMGLELPKGLGRHYTGMHQDIVATVTEGKGVSFGQSYSIEEAVKEVTLIKGLVVKDKSNS